MFLILASLAYITVASLLRPLTWGVLLAFVTYPAYQLLLRGFGGRHRSLAAGTMTLAVVLLLVIPSLAAGVVASREAIGIFGKIYDIVGNLDPSKGLSLEALLPDVVAKRLVPAFEEYPLIKEGVQQFLRWMTSTMVTLSRNFLGNTLTMAYHQIIIFIVFFFLLRDGHIILRYIKDIIPLMSEERDKFMARAGQVLRAVVFGVIATAGTQGILGALGWWFVGLSSPLLAGALMALLAMIPFVGTPSVWIPGAVYLFLAGDVKGSVLLALWGLLVVSSVDNFLRPYFISEKANMSTLLVFLGALGGLAAMGFIGLFLGPLILSLFVFFLDSYRRAWKSYQKSERSRLDEANENDAVAVDAEAFE